MKFEIKDGYKFLIDMILINILWLFVSTLGIFITLGAATTAMFSVAYKLLNVNNQTYIVKTFFKSFKDNFVVSTIIWFLILLIGTPLFFIYDYAVDIDNIVLLISIYFTAFQLIIFSLYVFPTIAKFETNSIFQLIKNSFLMANIHFFTTIKLLGSLAFAVFLVVKIHSFLILIAVGIFSIFTSFHLNKIFNIYIKKMEISELE